MQFNERTKKIILSVLFLMTVIVLGALIYFFFFRPLITGPGDTGTTTPDNRGGLPPSKEGGGQIGPEGGDTRLPGQTEPVIPADVASPSANGGLTTAKKLNNDPALGAKLAADGNNINYFNPSDNKFYHLDRLGQAVPLSDKEFPGLESVIWSNKSNLAVIEYPDGANIVYDFDREKQITLPAHWQDFTFSQVQDNLSMKILGTDPNNRYLAVSSYDGSRIKAIEPLGIYADTVTPTWSANEQVVGIQAKGIGFERQEIFFIGQNNENFKSIVVEGRGFEHIWSPSGDKMLYSVYTSENELKPSLWTISASGENIGQGRTNLNIDTWASKCVYYSETQIYCAVPQYLPEGAGFMPELAEGIPDNVYEIDPTTEIKKLIAVPDGEYQMESLMVDASGRYLYFVYQFSGNLHQIKLK